MVTITEMAAKKVSDLRVISQLFTKIYAERDRHEARLKELETRIVLLEGR